LTSALEIFGQAQCPRENLRVATTGFYTGQTVAEEALKKRDGGCALRGGVWGEACYPGLEYHPRKIF